MRNLLNIMAHSIYISPQKTKFLIDNIARYMELALFFERKLNEL